MSGVERDMVKQAQRTGQPIPDRIVNAPELRLGLSFYFDAFFELDSERSQGYGSVGRIPWSSIQQYADRCDLNEDLTECLFYFIRAMDNANLKRIQENFKPKGT